MNIQNPRSFKKEVSFGVFLMYSTPRTSLHIARINRIVHKSSDENEPVGSSDPLPRKAMYFGDGDEAVEIVLIHEGCMGIQRSMSLVRKRLAMVFHILGPILFFDNAHPESDAA